MSVTFGQFWILSATSLKMCLKNWKFAIHGCGIYNEVVGCETVDNCSSTELISLTLLLRAFEALSDHFKCRPKRFGCVRLWELRRHRDQPLFEVNAKDLVHIC